MPLVSFSFYCPLLGFAGSTASLAAKTRSLPPKLQKDLLALTRADLLSLAASPASKHAILEPASVPAASILTTTRPANGATNGAAAATNAPPKARRMSSSTTGVLGRGKLGLTGDAGLTSQV